MSAPRKRITRKGRERTGGFDATSLMAISADDVRAEREMLVKSRVRLEKLNEKLTKELELELRKETQWDDEIVLLEKNSRERQQMLDDKIRKMAFTWERDEKNLQLDLEQIHQRLEDYENEVDEQWEKTENKYEKELDELNAELQRVKKGGEEEADLLLKRQTELRDIQKKREAAAGMAKANKILVEEKEVALKAGKKNSKRLQEQIQNLENEEVELRRMEDAREETESNVQRAHKQIKRLKKEATKGKSEEREIADLQREFEEWNDKTKTEVETIERLQGTLKKLGRDQADSNDTDDHRSSRDDGDNEDDDASARRRFERELEELEKELKELEKTQQIYREELEEKMAQKKLETEKYERKIRTSEEALKERGDELKRLRDGFRKDERERSEKKSASETEYKQLNRDLTKARKEKDRETKSLLATVATQQKTSIQFARVMHNLSKTQTTNESLIEDEERIKLAKIMMNKNVAQVKEELEQTHALLQEQREILSSVQVRMKEYSRSSDDLISKLEEELYKETNATESLSKDRDTLLKEIKRLRWYFRPDKEQAPDQEVDPVAQEKFFERLREERLRDLHATRDKLKSIRPKSRTLQELQTAFQSGLALLDEDSREDMGYELEDLNVVMNKLNMPAKARFNMFVDFVENAIDAGIVREIGVLLEIQASPTGLHPLKTAEHVLNMSKKDFKLNPDTSFREVLLDRLAEERHQRVGKDLDYCRIVILEGGEEWGEADYNAAYGQ